MQSPSPDATLIGQVALILGGLSTLVTLFIGLYKLGAHSNDLKNTKENIGRDVRTMGEEMRRGFDEVKTWRNEDKEARHEANNRVTEVLGDHETRISVLESREIP